MNVIEKLVENIQNEAKSEFPNRDVIISSCECILADLQAPHQNGTGQAPQGEFTKGFRELIELSKNHPSRQKVGRMQTKALEACDRLDRQEVKKQKAQDDLAKLCCYIQELEEIRIPKLQAIIDRQEAELEGTRWIPVGERLPEIGQKVLAYFPTAITGPCAVIDWWKEAATELEDFTHWKPIVLPKP